MPLATVELVVVVVVPMVAVAGIALRRARDTEPKNEREEKDE